MPYPVTIGKRKRMSFSKIKEKLEAAGASVELK